tara:strand:+ start:201 stop:1394 length:1194 start_codon:yes stop_codon:yes gene_type:complete
MTKIDKNEMKKIFMQACDDKEGGHKTVVILLQKDFNINQRLDEHWNTPIMMSLIMNNVKIFSLLYDNNANINLPNLTGTTPLIEAVSEYDGGFYDTNIVRLLLDKGANPNASTTLVQTTPLQSVSVSGNNEFASLLLEHGANIDQQNSNRSTALNLAVEFEHLDTVKLLLKKGADPDIPDKHNIPPIYRAVSMKLYDIAKELLERHANPNVYDNDGMSPILLSAQYSDINMFNLLLENGADINDKSKLQIAPHTPLHEAIYNLNDNFIQFLLERGANYTIRNYGGLTPLQLTEKIKKEQEKELAQELKKYQPNEKEKQNENSDIIEYKKTVNELDNIINTFRDFIASVGGASVGGASAGGASAGGASAGGKRRRRRRKTIKKRRRRHKTTKKRRNKC